MLISTKCTCVLVCLHAQVTLGSAVCLMWRRVVAQHSAGAWFSWPIPSPDLSLSCDLSSFAWLSPSFSPNSGLDLCWRAVQHFRVLWWQLLWKGQRDFSVGHRIRYTRPHMKPIPDLALSNRTITDQIINLLSIELLMSRRHFIHSHSGRIVTDIVGMTAGRKEHFFMQMRGKTSHL